MASDVNIKGKISIDAGDSSQQIDNVKKSLNNVSTAAKGSHSDFGNLKESLSKLSPGFKESSEGVETLSKAFKALLMNPIVMAIAAITLALTGLYKAFTSTQSGAEKMEQIFSGLKAVMDVIVDRLVSFGNAIIKLFSGDFKGAADAAKKSVTGLKDEIGDAYNKAVELQSKLQNIKMEELQDAKDQQRRKARLAELKEMINDEDISIQERKKMARELKEDQEKDFKADFERSKQKSMAEIALIKNGRSEQNLSFEDKKKISELEIEVDRSLQEGKMEGVRINKLIRNLEKQDHAERKAEAAEEKRLAEEKKKRDKEILDAKLEAQKNLWARNKEDYDFEIKILTDIAKAEKEAREKKEAEDKKAQEGLWARNKEDAEFEIQIMRDSAKAQVDLEQAKVDAKMKLHSIEVNAINAFADLVGRQTLVGKGLAIASATIATYEAAAKSLKADYSSFGPLALFAKIAATATTVAVGLNNVKQIAAVQVPGQGGGAGVSVPSGNVAASSPLQPQLQSVNTNLNASSIQGIGNAAAGGAARTFVLDQDIKDSQERSARITRAARIG